MHTPMWALQILVDELPALEAHALEQAATAAITPHLKDHDRRELLRSLQWEHRPQGRMPAAAAPDSTEPPVRDLDAAAAYFASMGIRVVRPPPEVA